MINFTDEQLFEETKIVLWHYYDNPEESNAALKEICNILRTRNRGDIIMKIQEIPAGKF